MSSARSLLLASVALCTGASTAFASDLPTTKGPPPPPVAAPYSWTGFNVGLQGGYGWGVENDDLSTADFLGVIGLFADHFSAAGPIGGAHVGYDQQLGSLVLGVRSELDASGLHGSTVASSTVCSEGCTVTDASLAFHNTWQAFLLGRGGVAFDRLLVYVTGGVAFGDDRESATITQTGSSTGVWTGSQTKTLVGGAIGLGADYALDQHWRIGAEWRYVSFGKGDYSAIGPSTVAYKAGFSENLALFDVSYGF
jgi:outer membrane immunogenic protein